MPSSSTTAGDHGSAGFIAARDNEFAVDVLLDFTRLPAPTLISRPHAVYVSVADMDDLGRWVAERGGRVHVSANAQGVETWTLHTYTDRRRDGSRVAVYVSVTVPADEIVTAHILAAVVR